MPGAQHLEHGGLLEIADDRPRDRDHFTTPAPRALAGLGAAREPGDAEIPRCDLSMPASSESTSASHEASMTFSCTPIAPQVDVPSDASRSTRVVAPVAFHSSRMRTL